MWAKRVLRYLKGTVDFIVWYYKGYGRLEGYVDNDYDGSIYDSKRTVESVFKCGSQVFTRNSKKQDAVVQLKRSTL